MAPTLHNLSAPTLSYDLRSIARQSARDTIRPTIRHSAQRCLSAMTNKLLQLTKTLSVIIAISLASTSYATTVMQVDIDYLLDKAELVFEGEVIASQSKWNSEQTSIYTEIVFRVDDIVKGDYTEDTISLRFAGGEIGDVGLSISAMTYPDQGERGIYFVESLSTQLINPLVGWSQGHFLTIQDQQGVSRVLTEDHSPVLGIDNTATSSLPQSAPHFKRDPFSHGKAHGMQLGNKNTDIPLALDKATFKLKLKEKLNDQSETKLKEKSAVK